jgi:hypothetical protein
MGGGDRAADRVFGVFQVHHGSVSESQQSRWFMALGSLPESSATTFVFGLVPGI